MSEYCKGCKERQDLIDELEALVGQVRVDAEELRKALQPISEAQRMLEDNYHQWNDEGKRHAVESASKSLRNAHNRISQIYAQAIGLPNVGNEPCR
jgi:DNA repair exonuclease SbcCD ATPase subunit